VSAVPEGWTTHDGGPMPVDGDVWAEVLYRDGGKGSWFAENLGWSHDEHCSYFDIIAYQVITGDGE